MMIGRHTQAGRGPGVPAAYPIRGRTVHTGILNSSLAAHRSLRRGAALGRETVTAVPHLPAGGISLPDSSRPVSHSSPGNDAKESTSRFNPFPRTRPAGRYSQMWLARPHGRPGYPQPFRLPVGHQSIERPGDHIAKAFEVCMIHSAP